MVDVKMSGGDDPDRQERALYGVGAEILNRAGGADAAAIDNHQAVPLVRYEIRLSKATARNWMYHACLPQKPYRIAAGFVCAPTPLYVPPPPVM
jgi:hypothetical protein